MPDDTIDQADEAKTVAEVADDSDETAPGIEAVRKDLSERVAVVDGPGVLGARTMMQAFAEAKAAGGFSVSYDMGAAEGDMAGTFDTHAKDPQVDPVDGRAFLKAKEEYHRKLTDEDKRAIAASDAVTLADPPKSDEEIQKILFGETVPQPADPRVNPTPYFESDEERAKRDEENRIYTERHQRETACIIAARLHQGRGLNMQDFLDEADVIVEYIRDGYIQDFRA